MGAEKFHTLSPILTVTAAEDPTKPPDDVSKESGRSASCASETGKRNSSASIA